MEKKMEEIIVRTNPKDHLIVICQPVHGDDDSAILISPEQVDTLIAWLKEAKEELGA